MLCGGLNYDWMGRLWRVQIGGNDLNESCSADVCVVTCFLIHWTAFGFILGVVGGPLRQGESLCLLCEAMVDGRSGSGRGGGWGCT